jgi:hypothetical protein
MRDEMLQQNFLREMLRCDVVSDPDQMLALGSPRVDALQDGHARHGARAQIEGPLDERVR